MSNGPVKPEMHAFDKDGMVVCSPDDDAVAERAHADRTATEAYEDVTCPRCRELIPQPHAAPVKKTRRQQPFLKDVFDGVDRELRKGDLLEDIDPRAARELDVALLQTKTDEEAVEVIALYKDKVEKHMLEKRLQKNRERRRRQNEAKRKETAALAKAGKRRTIELAKENRLAKSHARYLDGGTEHDWCCGLRGYRRDVRWRNPHVRWDDLCLHRPFQHRARPSQVRDVARVRSINQYQEQIAPIG